jgi:hypothetical protein
MDKRQTEFLLSLFSILDDSLALNRHLIESIQAGIGPISVENYQLALQKLERIEIKYARLKGATIFGDSRQ